MEGSMATKVKLGISFSSELQNIAQHYNQNIAILSKIDEQKSKSDIKRFF